MVTLQQFKEKIIELFADDYYKKNEIDTKESTITGILSQKADKTNATQSNAGLMSAEDKIKLDEMEIGDYTEVGDLDNYYTKSQCDTQYSITVEKQSTADTGFSSTYVIKQNDIQKGVKINVPKDFLVKSTTVKTCNTANSPVSGYEVGDKYIDFVINSKDSTDTDEHLYLATKEIGAYPVDEVTLTVTNGKLAIKDNGVTWAKLATAVQNTINGKEVTSNKVTSVSASSTNTQYPSAKCVYDLVEGKSPNNHNHDSIYIKKTGGVSQQSNGNILIPSDADSSSYDATGYIPFAHTIQDTTKTLREILPTKKSFIGAVIGKKSDGSSGNQYDYVISARHRNGGGDGYKYGMYIRAPWTTNGNLSWAENNNGDYGTEKIILDSNNYSTYALSNTNGAVLNANIGNNQVNNAKLSDNAISTSKIQNKAVTNDKIDPVIFRGNGSGATAGYIKMIKFKFTSNAAWRDKPITFDLYNRTRKDNIHVSLKFKNVGDNDPDVDYFSYTSYDLVNLYLYKEETSTWSLIIQKELNGNMEIANLTIPNFNRDYLEYSNMNTQISTLPSNTSTNPLIQATQRTYGGTSNNNITAPAFIKSGGTSAQFLKANGSVETLNTTLCTVTYTDGTTSTINFVTR